MKIIKKILGIDEDLSKTANLFLFLFRLFSYVIPLLIVIWCFVIENIINKEVTIWAKIGCAGIVALVIVFLFAIHFIKKHFNKKLSKLTDKIIMCTDESKKLVYIKKKRKVEMWQELFGNICIIIPFAVLLALINMIETQMLSLRGIFFFVVISMIVGFVFNIALHIQREKDYENKSKNN